MKKEARSLNKRELRIRSMMKSLSESLEIYLADRSVGNEEILVAMATTMVAMGSHLGFSSAKIIRSICNVYEPRRLKKSTKKQKKKDSKDKDPIFIMTPPKDLQ